MNSVLDGNVTQRQFDAAVMLAFNIGSNFGSSSVVKMMNSPTVTTDFSTIEDAWKAWKYSQGSVNQGMINRRAAEWNVYSNGVYKKW